jgi:uncharacterized protein (DUF486 family)
MDTVMRWLLRLAGAGLLGATAGVHAYLYDLGYKSIPKIGVMFLLQVIGASVLCLAVIAVPRAWLALTAAAGAALQAATVVGLVIFTNYTIFNFRETTQAKDYWESVIIEVIGFAVLAGLAVAEWTATRRSPAQWSVSAGRA